MRSASYHYRSSSQASSLLASPAAHKKLVASMSMKVGGQGTRHTSKKDDVFAGGVAMGDKKRDKKLKHEDSVWKKTIILGEKCRVHHDSEEEIVLDEDGNRITPYRPKTSAAPPSMSRQSSAVDKRDKKLKHEDSVWKKTIILGEKCRVRHDSEEEVVFDEDGNRITSYRPKTSAAPPLT
nr:Phosphatidylinositol 3,4,5-trisphosphate 5-phosphatase [Ipomoea batatas]